jgi:ABC-type protease/lipase transport system fused ATPase/permease subunit
VLLLPYYAPSSSCRAKLQAAGVASGNWLYIQKEFLMRIAIAGNVDMGRILFMLDRLNSVLSF